MTEEWERIDRGPNLRTIALRMRIVLHEFDLRRAELRLRLPFRYGMATMTEAPLLFVAVRADVDGRTVTGVSSDLLPPKWFTKIPGKPIVEEIAEMLGVVRHACHEATGLRGESAFALWREVWQAQAAWGERERLPPLLTHFGTSLVERAIIDALCRASQRPFWRMLQQGALGLDLGSVHEELRGHHANEFLPTAPLTRITIRHTVGLGDPLTEADVPPGERLEDGLPQTLEECIRGYGLRHFKIKVSGDVDQDLARLVCIREVVAPNTGGDVAFTLDGNEQFESIETFRAFWEEILRRPALDSFFRHLRFVEQPLNRRVALEENVATAFAAWPEHPPIIIDESDANLEALPTALRLGYAGTSHKNCKGVFKGIAHRSLIEYRQRQDPNTRYLMSGEDLCTIGPVSLPQDLAVMSAFGIESVERNGHHYHPGLSCLPTGAQEQVLSAHPDLYHRSAAGWPALRITRGEVSLGSVNDAPFGVAVDPALKEFARA